MDEQVMQRAREQFNDCAAIFIALGDSVRQKIILDLAETGEEGINVAQISERSTLSRPAISYHLKVLKEAGLVAPVKKGTQIFYRLRMKRQFLRVKELLNTVEALIDEVEN